MHAGSSGVQNITSTGTARATHPNLVKFQLLLCQLPRFCCVFCRPKAHTTVNSRQLHCSHLPTQPSLSAETSWKVPPSTCPNLYLISQRSRLTTSAPKRQQSSSSTLLSALANTLQGRACRAARTFTSPSRRFLRARSSRTTSTRCCRSLPPPSCRQNWQHTWSSSRAAAAEEQQQEACNLRSSSSMCT